MKIDRSDAKVTPGQEVLFRAAEPVVPAGWTGKLTVEIIGGKARGFVTTKEATTPGKI